MIVFPTLEEALELHSRVIEAFGGSAGVRDLGMLESALYRPQMKYYESLFDKAAALLESLLMNHPFVDGNKRVAFFLTDSFLRLNGYRLDVSAQRTYNFFMKLIAHAPDRLDKIRAWLSAYAVELV